MTREENLRLDALIDSLTARLRPVCDDWPQEMFEQVVRELAEITLKYEGTATPGIYDRRRTDRLVADLKDVVERSQRSRDTPSSPSDATE